MNIKFTCEFISRFFDVQYNVVVDHLQARMHFLNYFFSVVTLEAVVSIDNTLGEVESVLEVDV